MRVLALAAAAAALFLVGAAEVPSHVRLPVAAVVVGATITQPFGCTTLTLEPFDPTCPTLHIHTGVDLAAPTGVEVHSATAGTAVVGLDPYGAGNYVAVAVDAHVRILYCHLSAFAVRSGDTVSPPGRTSTCRSTSAACPSTRRSSLLLLLNNLGRHARFAGLPWFSISRR